MNQRASLLLQVFAAALTLQEAAPFVISPAASTRLLRAAIFTAAASSEEDEEPDLFDYFDPLLSPHAYPNGISPDSKKLEDISSSPPPAADSLGQFDLLGLLSSTAGGYEELPAVRQQQSAKIVPPVPETPDPEFFDPRISPHVYTRGAPDQFIGDAPSEKPPARVIGVLLMDHGSRNQASNDRLHELARLYQNTVGGDNQNMVVTAAHMEIAPPSIPEGLQTLLDAGVDEIICHPYFLSAKGRHVSEDIPEIIEAAIADLEITIPLSTTEPVGSQTDVMIRAMHSLVSKSATSIF